MKKRIRRTENKDFGILVSEAYILSLLFILMLPFILGRINADVGGNATAISSLEVGKSAPIVTEVHIEDGSITLTPNSTTPVNCTVEVVDFDTEVDIANVTAEFFDETNSFYGDSDDNNYHYTNTSCEINFSYGDINTVLAHCLFDVEYYANAGSWNCTANASDISNFTHANTNTSTIESLLAVGLPDSLNYGLVNATYVSNESIVNVTNLGNVLINLSLSGYATEVGDPFAMNCSLGGNISIDYEKYNVSTSNPGNLDLSSFENVYFNLTNASTVREYNLAHRQNDALNDAMNETYWRIYVPLGVGGSCQGNIVIGANQAPE